MSCNLTEPHSPPRLACLNLANVSASNRCSHIQFSKPIGFKFSGKRRCSFSSIGYVNTACCPGMWCSSWMYFTYSLTIKAARTRSTACFRFSETSRVVIFLPENLNSLSSSSEITLAPSGMTRFRARQPLDTASVWFLHVVTVHFLNSYHGTYMHLCTATGSTLALCC